MTKEKFASLSEGQRISNEKNRLRFNERCRNRRAKNIEEYRKREKKYRDSNREKERERQRMYRENNLDKVREIKRVCKHRARMNPVKRLADSVSCRLRIALRAMGRNKVLTASEYVGCDWSSLKSYLEMLFLPGMTWENHGVHGWHIDHIIPISSAMTEHDVRRLSHYTNLRPLWAIDNLSKHAKIL